MTDTPDSTPSPRAASVLFARALGHVDLVQPATLREPIRLLLTAGIETCASKRSLVGLPTVYTVEIARGLLDAVAAMPAQGGSDVPYRDA